MRKYIILLIIALCELASNFKSEAATAYPVTVVQSPFIGSSFTQDDLWNFQLINQGTGSLFVSIVIELKTTDNTLVTRISSQPFLVSTGINVNFSLIRSTSSQVYFNNNFSIELQSSGQLSSGDFQWCIHVASSNIEYDVIGDGCQPVTISGFSNLQLSYPADMDTVNVSPPSFVWHPLISQQQTHHYEITIAPIYSGQSNAEALASNGTLLQEDFLTTNNFVYPASAPELINDSSYVWQVTAKNGVVPIATSEVWRFTFSNALHSQATSHPNSYTIIERNLNRYTYLFNNIVRFSYRNTTNDSTLHYSILNMMTGDSLRSAPYIHLKHGVNKIDIDLSNYPITHSGRYLLQVYDANNEHYQLTFTLQ